MVFDLQAFFGFNGVHIPEPGPSGTRATQFAVIRSEAELFGYASVGIPPCLDGASLVDRRGNVSGLFLAICSLAESGLPILVSGGDPGPRGLDVVDWRVRTQLYADLASHLGRQLYVAVPGDPGSQTDLLERTHAMAFELRLVAMAGAQFVLPMGAGAFGYDEFAGSIQDVLGTKVIPWFRLDDGLLSEADVSLFVRASRPEKIHLSGVPKERSRFFHAGLLMESPTLLISEETELAMGVRDGEGDASEWSGWEVRDAFLNHPLAHQYQGSEAISMAALERRPVQVEGLRIR